MEPWLPDGMKPWVPCGPAALPMFSPIRPALLAGGQQTSTRLQGVGTTPGGSGPCPDAVDIVRDWMRQQQQRERQSGRPSPVGCGFEPSDVPQLTLHARLERVRYNIRVSCSREDQQTTPEGQPTARRRTKQCCKFCKRNAEKDYIVTHHCLKDGAGNVTCPLLQQYTCAVCKATGAQAHTVNHCPLVTHGVVSEVEVMKGRYFNQLQNRRERGRIWCQGTG